MSVGKIANWNGAGLNFVTWLVRLLTGGLFIFSGFVKAIDPWGTLYKFYDYSAALHIEVWRGLMVASVFALCTLEFLLGVFLVFGCFRRSTPIFTALFMAVMTPLTLWIAVKDPVADCGCFGDALIISNWATFWKNILLCVLTVWLIMFNRKAGWLIRPYMQWLAVVASTLFIFTIAFIGYMVQPLLDFRPYRVGTPLLESEETDDTFEASDMVFVYSKEGVEKEFRADEELPDEESGWKFVERRVNSPLNYSKSSLAASQSSKALRIWSEDGSEDVTDDFIDDTTTRLFLIIPDLKEVSVATTWIINSLYEWCTHQDVQMVALVSGDEEEISGWKDISMAEYPIYTAEDTDLKEAVRGNPAVIYTSNGIIDWKTSLRGLHADDFLSAHADNIVDTMKTDNQRFLINISLIYVAVLATLITLSFSPKIIVWPKYFSKKDSI